MKKQKKLALIKNIITVVFLVVAAVFFYRSLQSSIEKVMQEDFRLNWGLFGVAMLIYFLYFVFLASLWHFVTVLNRSSIPYWEAITCYAFSVLGKYIPGEIFMLLARFPAYERRGVKPRKVTVNFYLENLGTLLGAAFLFIGSLLFFPNDLLDKYKWVIVAAFLGLAVCTNPRIINLILRFLERFLKGKELQISITYPQMLAVVFLFILNWILVGSGFYLLVCSVYPISPHQLLYVAGVFGLAVMVGMVTFFAPSGLGVREGLIVVGLGVIMPNEQAVIISLLARVWATVAEVLFILLIYVIRKVGQRTGWIRTTRVLKLRKEYRRSILKKIGDRRRKRHREDK